MMSTIMINKERENGMSGPKVDYVALERQRQEQLAREREERIARFSSLMASVERCGTKIQEIEKCVAAFTRRIAGYEVFQENKKQLDEAASNAKKGLWECLGQKMNLPPETDHGKYISEVMLQKEKVDKVIADSWREFETVYSWQSSFFESHLKKIEQTKPIIDLKIEDGTGPNSTEEERLVVFNSTPAQRKKEEEQKRARQEALEKLTGFKDSGQVFVERKANLEETIQSIEKSQHEDEKEMEGIWELIRNLGEDQTEYEKYKRLCEYSKIQHNANNEMRPMSDIQDREAVREKINTMEEDIQTKEERRYIRETLQTVMTEFGYEQMFPLVLNETREEGEDNYIALPSENGKDKNRSSLHVKCSNNGEIVMEVADVYQSRDAKKGGEKCKGNAIRKANPSEEMQEKRKSFCEQHKEMIERLKEMGILLENRTDNPVDVSALEIALTDVTQEAETKVQRKIETETVMIDDRRRYVDQ